MKIYIVYMVEEDNNSIIKAFYNRKDADNYINSMYTMPQEDSEGYVNDDYIDPGYLFIDDIEVE